VPVIDCTRNHDETLLAERCAIGRRDSCHACNSSSQAA
jgi:hypothetical protein